MYSVRACVRVCVCNVHVCENVCVSECFVCTYVHVWCVSTHIKLEDVLLLHSNDLQCDACAALCRALHHQDQGVKRDNTGALADILQTKMGE